MAILAFFSMFGLFIQPVSAASYKVDNSGTIYTKITCGLCSGSKDVVHKMLKSTYDKRYKGYTSDMSKVQIECTLCGGTHCKIALDDRPVCKLAYKLAVGANSDFATYKSILTDEDAGTTLFQVLQFDPSTQGGNINFVQRLLYREFAMVAWFIIAIYFILELGEGAMEDKLTYEFFLYLVVKALISIVIVTNSPDWIIEGLKTMTGIFNSLAANVAGNGIFIYEIGNCAFDSLVGPNASFWGALGDMFTNAIFCITVMISYVIIFGIAWARVFDIFLRIAFAPIGLADFYHGGTKCLAVRYFKKLLASLLQGACMMGVLMSYQTINAAMRGGKAGPIVGVILGLAVITAITQTGEIANDAIGD